MDAASSFEQSMTAHWIPNAPLAAEHKSGPYRRRNREDALKLPYIEANPTCMQSLVITDHDGGMADELPGLLGLPAPSWTALNPHTRCGHIVYVLGCAVCLTDTAKRGPVNLLARVETGLCAVLGGDYAYAGRITKNPTHEQHLPLWGPQTAVYGLKELAGALSSLKALPAYNDRTAIRISGVGRNVDLFNLIRKWSYRRRGDYRDQQEWDDVVEAYAWDRNLVVIGEQFTRGPLARAEVHHLARSVSRWTWRNIKRSLPEEQARRGQNSGQARRGDKLERVHAEIRKAAHR